MKITDIILHHFGGLKNNSYASTINVTAKQVSRYHKSRWNFPSKYIFNESIRYAGYNFIYLPPTRKFVQTRAIGETGAHVIGLNNSSIGLAIAGNYTKNRIGSPRGTVDKLTDETVKDVTEFIYDLIHGECNATVAPNTEIDLSSQRVHPHRFFSNTQCYGNGISNNFFRDKLIEFEKKNIIFNLLKSFYWHLLDIQQKREIKKAILGRSILNDREDPEFVEVIS